MPTSSDIENDAEVKRFVGGPSGESEARYRELISKLAADCSCLTIEMINNQRPVGRCGIIVSDDEAEIHLILAKDYWKQKLGTEAAIALTELAAEKFPGKTLVAKVHPSNNASLAILHGLGMVPLGRISSSGYDNDFVRFEDRVWRHPLTATDEY